MLSTPTIVAQQSTTISRKNRVSPVLCRAHAGGRELRVGRQAVHLLERLAEHQTFQVGTERDGATAVVTIGSAPGRFRG